jgi:hypothetical protein
LRRLRMGRSSAFGKRIRRERRAGTRGGRLLLV